jgi:hypothetical protein
MGIELPAELADVAQRTGAQWPEADEDAMQAQATAWRDAAKGLRTLAADADASANGVLEGMSGDAGDAVRRTWSGFVDPDRGSLTAAAQGAEQAADRLEHAATQIGEGKVEIVRQLVNAARNEEAARAAADGGHPTALLGVQNLLGAVSTNLASVTDSLVGSVADTGRALDPTEQVNPHPGSRGEGGRSGGGLLAAVSGLAGDAVTGTTDAVVGRDGVLPKAAEAAHGLADTTGGVVDRAADTAGGAVDRAADTTGGAVDRAGDTVGEAAHQGGRSVSEALDGGSHPVSDALDGGATVVRDTAEDVSPDASTPPSGLAVGGAASGSFAEAVTPRSGIPIGPSPAQGPPGQTSLAGYADAPLPPAGQPPSAAPPLPGAAAAAGQPGSAFGPFGGQPAAGPPVGASPAGSAPGAPGGQPAGAQPGSHAGQQQPQRLEPRQPPAAQQPPQRLEPRAPVPQPAPQQPPAQQPAQPPPAQQPLGSPRSDRKSLVALFLVHMFPIGHLPKAANEPARQLPPPAQEADLAGALRFEPHDHPDSAVFDDAHAVPERATDAPGLAAAHPAVAAQLDVYDPLAGLHERDWERRYLVKQDAKSTEYAWPPGEVYPEGCHEDGEPILLEPGTVIDRFGGPHGRVFAADATPYHKRSLPPPTEAADYRRYRVLRELPVWRGVTASWFGQPGSSVRYRAVYPARDLVVLGYLEDITAETAGGTA